MVALCQTAEPPPQTPPRARGQDRSPSSRATRCSNPNPQANLREATHEKHARLGSCSRDPIGYEGGISLFNYVAGHACVAVDPSGLNPASTWQHHWFPQNETFVAALDEKCACHWSDFGVSASQFVDMFTTPITPGGMNKGYLHGYIENEFGYGHRAQAVVRGAPDCCSALVGIQFLIVDALVSADNSDNGDPSGPLQPDPANYLPWPPLVPYGKSGPNMDAELLKFTMSACRGGGRGPTRVPSRTGPGSVPLWPPKQVAAIYWQSGTWQFSRGCGYGCRPLGGRSRRIPERLAQGRNTSRRPHSRSP